MSFFFTHLKFYIMFFDAFYEIQRWSLIVNHFSAIAMIDIKYTTELQIVTNMTGMIDLIG